MDGRRGERQWDALARMAQHSGDWGRRSEVARVRRGKTSAGRREEQDQVVIVCVIVNTGIQSDRQVRVRQAGMSDWRPRSEGRQGPGQRRRNAREFIRVVTAALMVYSGAAANPKATATPGGAGGGRSPACAGL